MSNNSCVHKLKIKWKKHRVRWVVKRIGSERSMEGLEYGQNTLKFPKYECKMKENKTKTKSIEN